MQKNNKTLLILSIIFGGLAFLFLFIGSLFKLMHWPGSAIALMSGGLLAVIALILIIIWSAAKTNN
jgi:hypothetical protein